MTAPASVDELVPAAIELAERQGTVPSKDRLMKTFRIGRPKASEIYRRVQMESAKRRSRRSLVQARRPPSRRVLQARVIDPAAALAARVPQAAVGPLPAGPPDPIPPQVRRVATWPALVVAAPAAVAIWAGWVAIGKLTGFGKVNLLPGVGQGWVVDTAITLPIGVEAYAAYAFYVALSPAAPRRARVFGAWSAGLAVLLGMGGQTAYHLMSAAGMTIAPWQITTVVSCLPVGVFAVVAALVHMVRAENNEEEN
jgi:hypothetical protein